jgi:hypothetical protein
LIISVAASIAVNALIPSSVLWRGNLAGLFMGLVWGSLGGLVMFLPKPKPNQWTKVILAWIAGLLLVLIGATVIIFSVLSLLPITIVDK